MQGNGRYYSTRHISPPAGYSTAYDVVHVLNSNPEHFATYSFSIKLSSYTLGKPSPSSAGHISICAPPPRTSGSSSLSTCSGHSLGSLTTYSVHIFVHIQQNHPHQRGGMHLVGILRGCDLKRPNNTLSKIVLINTKRPSNNNIKIAHIIFKKKRGAEAPL